MTKTIITGRSYLKPCEHKLVKKWFRYQCVICGEYFTKKQVRLIKNK